MKRLQHGIYSSAMRSVFCLAMAGLLIGAVSVSKAQGQAAEPWQAGCLVKGLDPNGDGFLSIRTGPGSQNREIARVRNGDALYHDTRQCQGKWCFAQGASVSGQETNLQGWFYTAWCEFYP